MSRCGLVASFIIQTETWRIQGALGNLSYGSAGECNTDPNMKYNAVWPAINHHSNGDCLTCSNGSWWCDIQFWKVLFLFKKRREKKRRNRNVSVTKDSDSDNATALGCKMYFSKQTQLYSASYTTVAYISTLTSLCGKKTCVHVNDKKNPYILQ